MIRTACTFDQALKIVDRRRRRELRRAKLRALFKRYTDAEHLTLAGAILSPFFVAGAMIGNAPQLTFWSATAGAAFSYWNGWHVGRRAGRAAERAEILADTGFARSAEQ